VIVNTEPPYSVGCRGLKTNARRGQSCQRSRAGYDTAFVPSELHAQLISDGSLSSFGSLYGESQSLILVFVLDVQTEVVDEQRRLHIGPNGGDAD
jgi:hypothetical protein